MANQDEIVRRHVLQAVAWDPTKEEMPQWFKEAPQHDPYKFVTREDQLRHWRALVPLGPSYQKQADNLLGNLLRLCDISNHHHSEKSEDAPDLTESIKVSEAAGLSLRADLHIVARSIGSFENR